MSRTKVKHRKNVALSEDIRDPFLIGVMVLEPEDLDRLASLLFERIDEHRGKSPPSRELDPTVSTMAAKVLKLKKTLEALQRQKPAEPDYSSLRAYIRGELPGLLKELATSDQETSQGTGEEGLRAYVDGEIKKLRDEIYAAIQKLKPSPDKPVVAHEVVPADNYTQMLNLIRDITGNFDDLIEIYTKRRGTTQESNLDEMYSLLEKIGAKSPYAAMLHKVLCAVPVTYGTLPDVHASLIEDAEKILSEKGRAKMHEYLRTFYELCKQDADKIRQARKSYEDLVRSARLIVG